MEIMKKIIVLMLILCTSVFAQNELVRNRAFIDSTNAHLTRLNSLYDSLRNVYTESQVNSLLNQKQNAITNLADTSKYVEQSDTNTILSYTKALINSKQATISNLSDTSKYVEKSDTSTVLAYTKALINGKQNTISNISDTSKYVEIADTTGILAYTKALINGKQATISNLADTSKYVERTDTTAILEYTKALVNSKQAAISNIADTSKYVERADTTTILSYTKSLIDGKQAVIANIADTSKYVEKTDSSTLFYNRTAIDSKFLGKADSSYVLALLSQMTPAVTYKNYNPNLPRYSPFGGIQDTWGAYWMYPNSEEYWLNNKYQLHMKEGHGSIVENPEYDSLNRTPSALKCAIGYDVDYTDLAGTGTPRCEIYWNYDLQDFANDTLIYTWKTYIPEGTQSDYTGSTLATDIHQVWHAKHLQLYGSKYAMDVQDASLAYHRDTTSIGSWLGDIGKWVNWRVEMTARGTDGGATYWKLYKNNVLVYSDTYANLRPGDSEAMLKWGLYKSDWHATSSLIDTLSIYIDEIQINNETDNTYYFVMDFGDSTAANYGNTTGDDLRATISLNGINLYNTATTYDPTNYYISLSGNSGNSGHHPDSSWTVTEFNSFAFSRGDTIFFKRGETFRTQLTMNDQRVTISAYGTGADPIINGSVIQTGFANYSGSIYTKTSTEPRQLFFNSVRGTLVSAIDSVNGSGDWYYSSGSLYVYGNTDTIEAALLNYGINLTADSCTIRDLHIAKTYNAAINIASGADYNTIDNCEFISWTNEKNNANGGVLVTGTNSTITNSVFGRNTGNDISDQSYAGYNGIYITGANTTVSYCTFSHTSVENAATIAEATAQGSFGSYIPNNIRVAAANIRVSGKTWIHHNTFYHPGAYGVIFFAATEPGDTLLAEYNTASYCGQAGISFYQTRAASDGSAGGVGIVRYNTVSYSNRLGGSPGGGGDLSLGGTTPGNLAAGIHFNDGVQSGINWNRRFIQCYCYENEVSYSQNPDVRDNPDSDGIAVDFNAQRTRVFRNYLHHNDGKGVYVWNADSAYIYSNLIAYNGLGILIASSATSDESSVYNRAEGNTLYYNANYNSNTAITDIRAEIGFGYKSKNTVIRNNVVFARDTMNAIERFCFRYDSSGQWNSTNVVDYNIYYRPGADLTLMRDAGGTDRSWSSWTSTHATWDTHSYNSDPLINTTTFKLNVGSPAIDKGISIYSIKDYYKNPITGTPDIGACEFVLE
jgi:hypothetical protein